MNKQEFARAFQLADSDAVLTADLGIFWCCGLKEFEPVVVTIEGVARFLRWEAHQFNGEWDMDELQKLAYIARHKFTLLN